MAYGNLPGGGFSGYIKADQPLSIAKRSYVPVKEEWPPKYGVYGEKAPEPTESLRTLKEEELKRKDEEKLHKRKLQEHKPLETVGGLKRDKGKIIKLEEEPRIIEESVEKKHGKSKRVTPDDKFLEDDVDDTAYSGDEDYRPEKLPEDAKLRDNREIATKKKVAKEKIVEEKTPASAEDVPIDATRDRERKEMRKKPTKIEKKIQRKEGKKEKLGKAPEKSIEEIQKTGKRVCVEDKFLEDDVEATTSASDEDYSPEKLPEDEKLRDYQEIPAKKKTGEKKILQDIPTKKTGEKIPVSAEGVKIDAKEKTREGERKEVKKKPAEIEKKIQRKDEEKLDEIPRIAEKSIEEKYKKGKRITSDKLFDDDVDVPTSASDEYYTSEKLPEIEKIRDYQEIPAKKKTGEKKIVGEKIPVSAEGVPIDAGKRTRSREEKEVKKTPTEIKKKVQRRKDEEKLDETPRITEKSIQEKHKKGKRVSFDDKLFDDDVDVPTSASDEYYASEKMPEDEKLRDYQKIPAEKKTGEEIPVSAEDVQIDAEKRTRDKERKEVKKKPTEIKKKIERKEDEEKLDEKPRITEKSTKEKHKKGKRVTFDELLEDDADKYYTSENLPEDEKLRDYEEIRAKKKVEEKKNVRKKIPVPAEDVPIDAEKSTRSRERKEVKKKPTEIKKKIQIEKEKEKLDELPRMTEKSIEEKNKKGKRITLHDKLFDDDVDVPTSASDEYNTSKKLPEDVKLRDYQKLAAKRKTGEKKIVGEKIPVSAEGVPIDAGKRTRSRERKEVKKKPTETKKKIQRRIDEEKLDEKQRITEKSVEERGKTVTLDDKLFGDDLDITTSASDDYYTSEKMPEDEKLRDYQKIPAEKKNGEEIPVSAEDVQIDVEKRTRAGERKEVKKKSSEIKKKIERKKDEEKLDDKPRIIETSIGEKHKKGKRVTFDELLEDDADIATSASDKYYTLEKLPKDEKLGDYQEIPAKNKVEEKKIVKKKIPVSAEDVPIDAEKRAQSRERKGVKKKPTEIEKKIQREKDEEKLDDMPRITEKSIEEKLKKGSRVTLDDKLLGDDVDITTSTSDKYYTSEKMPGDEKLRDYQETPKKKKVEEKKIIREKIPVPAEDTEDVPVVAEKRTQVRERQEMKKQTAEKKKIQTRKSEKERFAEEEKSPEEKIDKTIREDDVRIPVKKRFKKKTRTKKVTEDDAKFLDEEDSENVRRQRSKISDDMVLRDSIKNSVGGKGSAARGTEEDATLYKPLEEKEEEVIFLPKKSPEGFAEVTVEDEKEMRIKFRKRRRIHTYTYYKRKRSLLRFCPCLDRLLHSKRMEYRVLKAMLGFPIGALFGFALYWLVLDRMEAGRQYMWLLGTCVGIGFALSTQVRCICLLSIPACFGRAGRAFVSTYVVAYVIEGPLTNIMLNSKEAMRSISCTTSLNLNHSMERFQLMFKPVKEIVMDFVGAGDKVQKDAKQLEKTFDDVEKEVRDEDEIRKSMADVQEMDEEIGGESRSNIIRKKFRKGRRPVFGEVSEKKYGMKSEFRCEEIFTKGVRSCYDSFGKAYDRCHSYLPIIGYLLCWPMKLTFICDLASSMMGKRTCDSDEVMNPGFGASVDTADGVQAEFDKDFAVQLQYKLIIPEERVDQLVPQDISEAMKYSFERRKRNLEFFMKVADRILALLCLLVINSSRKYCNQYLRIIQFDNKYVTGYFKHVDARRRKKEKVVLLPLKKGEKLELSDPFSVRFSADEKMLLIVSGLRLVSELFTVTILLLFDRIFYELLAVIQRHAQVTYKQTGVHHIKMTIYGDGFVGNMVRGILKGFDKKHSADQVTTTEECLPLPTKLSRERITRLYIVFLLMASLIVTESYTLRLRRVICAFFYPKREKRRILFLYNDRLKKRRSFLKHMRHQVRKQAREQSIAMDSGVFFSLRLFHPKYFNWISKLSLGLAQCLICSERESKKCRLISCPECPFSYCSECWQDTEGKCYACLPDVDTEPSEESASE